MTLNGVTLSEPLCRVNYSDIGDLQEYCQRAR